MKKLYFLVLPLGLMVMSCANRNLVVTYSEEPEATATVTIVADKMIKNTYLTVDGQQLLENRHVQSVEIKGLPEGTHEFVFVTESGAYKDTLNEQFVYILKEGESQIKMVERPKPDLTWVGDIVGGLLNAIRF